MPGGPLDLCEREEIPGALIECPDASWARIARRVGRRPATVAREIAGGAGRGAWWPAAAQGRAELCRRRPPRRR